MKIIDILHAILPKGFLKFIALVIVTIAFTYSAPREFASLWYFVLLVVYFRSRDEAFWLAFIFVTVDGFIGFFGIYSTTISIIPGLPSIEMAQFYILLSMVKASRSRKRSFVFYYKYLVVLLVYLGFMVAWGQLMGFGEGLNEYFRIVKLTLPLLLFYSLPRLFPDSDSFKRFFSFIFIVVMFAFITQVFTLITGLSPAGYIQLTQEQAAESGAFRGFPNYMASLLGLFGALMFLSYKKKAFNPIHLYAVIACAFANAYLSATRSWILFFSMVIFLSFLFVYRLTPKRLFGFGAVFVVFMLVGLDNPILKKQSEFAVQRLTTLEALAAGDLSAGGTLKRLDFRSPRIMKYVNENPVFGWGFSKTAINHNDPHVGNQNVLLFSGYVGLAMLVGFFIFFCYKMFARFLNLPRDVLNKNAYLVFIVMLMGWFFQHSSGAQHFGFYGLPLLIIPQAVFFSFGALLYAKPSELSK